MKPSTQESATAPVCAVLLNPNLDEEKSTSYAVLRMVAERKGWTAIEVGNLLPVRTRNSKLLARASLKHSDIVAARPPIDALLSRSTEVVFAWGVSSLPGALGRLQREQIEWVFACAVKYGHEEAWVMGGTTRHPSRWRQYVGAQRSLYHGGSTIDRLEQALVRRPIDVHTMWLPQGKVEDGRTRVEVNQA